MFTSSALTRRHLNPFLPVNTLKHLEMAIALIETTSGFVFNVSSYSKSDLLQTNNIIDSTVSKYTQALHLTLSHTLNYKRIPSVRDPTVEII